jgi:hypothetical protein
LGRPNKDEQTGFFSSDFNFCVSLMFEKQHQPTGVGGAALIHVYSTKIRNKRS